MSAKTGLIFLIVLLFLLNSYISNNDNIIAKHINKTLIFDHCKELPVVLDNDTISFIEFRQQYDYISVAFFDEECDVCKVNLLEWYKHGNRLPVNNKHAYLMVFRGRDFRKFTKFSIHKDTTLNFKASVLIDRFNRYISDNIDIPREIIDRSMLIDKNNKIMLIGEPFATAKMTNLYRELIEINE